MKRYLLALFLFLFSLSGFSQDTIVNLLPDPFSLTGLQTAGEPKIYSGEDLFEMINGGADIYLEYGFVKTVSQNYSGLNGNTSLRIEIYQMTDPDAAYGIFASSTMGQQIVEQTGFYVVRGMGYGMMVRGSYFIVASYANLPENLNGNILKRIAEDFNSKISTYAVLPKLQVSTRPPCPDAKQSLYFRGPLALRSVSYIDFKIPFDFSEGIFSCMEIIIQPPGLSKTL